MNIDYFKEFAVLAETKNYWEASARLYLNQSTLSKHIKAMEKDLGVPLFKRTTRSVELTEFGAALLPYAQSITKIQFEYSTLLMQKKNRSRHLVTIGSIPAMAQYQITGLLLDFKKIRPSFTPRIIEDDTKVIKNLLLQKRCELAFLRETQSSIEHDMFNGDKITRIPYMTDHAVAVLPGSHPLAGRETLTLRELQDEAFCFLKENTMLYDLCRVACQEADFIPNIAFDSHRLDSILEMVASGGYAALLMDKHVESTVKTSTGKPASFAAVKITPEITTQISLCYLKDAPLSDTARRFIEYAASQAEKNTPL